MKGAASWFVHLWKFRLSLPSFSFGIHVNCFKLQLSLFLYDLLSLWCFSIDLEALWLRQLATLYHKSTGPLSRCSLEFSSCFDSSKFWQSHSLSHVLIEIPHQNMYNDIMLRHKIKYHSKLLNIVQYISLLPLVNLRTYILFSCLFSVNCILSLKLVFVCVFCVVVFVTLRSTWHR